MSLANRQQALFSQGRGKTSRHTDSGAEHLFDRAEVLPFVQPTKRRAVARMGYLRHCRTGRPGKVDPDCDNPGQDQAARQRKCRNSFAKPLVHRFSLS